jgi:hypothetical protein
VTPRKETAQNTFDRRPPLPDSPRAPKSSKSEVPVGASDDLMPTTSVLTATTLTYAIRAGITAFLFSIPYGTLTAREGCESSLSEGLVSQGADYILCERLSRLLPRSRPSPTTI